MDTQQISEKVDHAVGGNHKEEGKTTKTIEKITAAVPSATWLLLGGGAMATSLVLKLAGRHKTADFIGQWVPTILLLGIYNKIVKTMGSDRSDAA